MKRAIPRSVLEQMKASRQNRDDESRDDESRDAEERAPSEPRGTPARGTGGAWKAGAMAQVEGDLAVLKDAQVQAVLSGARELSLDPALIDDPLGSDRRPDWADTAGFVALKDSIARNGQDVPVQVWPADPAWAPDPRDPLEAGEARFHLLSGRRRRAACAALGLPVRAVLVPPPAGLSEAQSRFAMLFHRFRENEAREDLSPFERLVSIGEIYEALTTAEEGAPTAVAFAARIGVHESIVSRARAVWRHRDAILARESAPYDLTFKALQGVLAEIEGRISKAPAKKPDSRPVSAKVEQGGRVLSAKADKGTITVKTDALDLDQAMLEAILKKIAVALPKARKPKKGRPIVD